MLRVSRICRVMSEVTKTPKQNNLISIWLVWHFYEMPQFLLMVWKNFLDFGANFFSIPLLLKTFFSPWRRYKWRYPKGFNIGEFFSTLISNIFSRIFGAVARLVLIVIGVILEAFIFITGGVIFILWFLIPFIFIILIILFFYRT